MGSQFLMLRGCLLSHDFSYLYSNSQIAKTCTISWANKPNFDTDHCPDTLQSTGDGCTPRCNDNYEGHGITEMKCTVGGADELEPTGTCTGKARNKRGRGELLISIDNFGVAFIFLTLG